MYEELEFGSSDSDWDERADSQYSGSTLVDSPGSLDAEEAPDSTRFHTDSRDLEVGLPFLGAEVFSLVHPKKNGLKCGFQ